LGSFYFPLIVKTKAKTAFEGLGQKIWIHHGN